jgi:hypothetical protein
MPYVAKAFHFSGQTQVDMGIVHTYESSERIFEFVDKKFVSYIMYSSAEGYTVLYYYLLNPAHITCF